MLIRKDMLNDFFCLTNIDRNGVGIKKTCALANIFDLSIFKKSFLL
jgi:hypothetical protein